MSDARDIIRRPVVTEKSNTQLGEDCYTFAVDPRANKNQIKEAIEEIFEVKVKSVHTMRVLGKMRRMGVHQGRQTSWKKAIVKLKEGHKIDLFEN